MIKSISKIGFSLLKWPYLHRTYLVIGRYSYSETVCNHGLKYPYLLHEMGLVDSQFGTTVTFWWGVRRTHCQIFVGADAPLIAPLTAPLTDATGWMMGNHPSQLGQVVTRHVCINHDSRCQWNISIKIVNCGQFYVYYLKEISISDSYGYRCARYCTV